MNLIINWCESLIQCVMSLFQLVFMMISGLINLGTILMESVNVLMQVSDFLPSSVSTAFFAVLGIMVTLRILGAMVHV